MIVAMGVYALCMSITPGPVNTVTLLSGIQNGFRKTNRFVLGATTGFIALLLLIGLGLEAVLKNHPLILTELSYFGAAYFLYIAYLLYKASKFDAKK